MMRIWDHTAPSDKLHTMNYFYIPITLLTNFLDPKFPMNNILLDRCIANNYANNYCFYFTYIDPVLFYLSPPSLRIVN